MTPRHTDTETHRLTLRLPAALYEQLRAQAFEGRTTISAIVVAALSFPGSSSEEPAPAATPISEAAPPSEGSVVGRVFASRER